MDIDDDNNGGPPSSPGGANSNDHNNNYNDILSRNDISRIIRETVGSKVIISQEAEEFIQELTLKFIGLITSEAERICAETENRTIITPDDILCSLSTRLGIIFRNQNILIPNHNPVESLEGSFSEAGDENSSS